MAEASSPFSPIPISKTKLKLSPKMMTKLLLLSTFLLVLVALMDFATGDGFWLPPTSPCGENKFFSRVAIYEQHCDRTKQRRVRSFTGCHCNPGLFLNDQNQCVLSYMCEGGSVKCDKNTDFAIRCADHNCTGSTFSFMPQRRTTPCSGSIFLGCHCKPGYVRNETGVKYGLLEGNGWCILPEQCPPVDDGFKWPSGWKSMGHPRRKNLTNE